MARNCLRRLIRSLVGSRHPGPLAQWERVSLTRRRSEVQILYGPPGRPSLAAPWWGPCRVRTRCGGASTFESAETLELRAARALSVPSACGPAVTAGSAAAARSRATDAAETRAHPAAILGLRRCMARAIQGTWITAFGASTAIASTVSRRGHRRPHHTPRTTPTTVKASLYWGVCAALKKAVYRDWWRSKWRSRRRAAGPGVLAAAGAVGPGSRNRPSRCRRCMFCSMF